MITNANITVYHKNLDTITHLETWERKNYVVWAFINEKANISEGFQPSNNGEIRIPYDENEINVENFAKGDFVIVEKLEKDIKSISELKEYKKYVITSFTDNKFGNNPHLHLGVN